MKHAPIKPAKLIVRCFALERKGYWVAMCIDFDLTVQADSAVKAKKLLREQMVSYVEDALTIHSDHAVELLTRRAPLKYVLWYHAIRLFNGAKNSHKKTFETAMPMVPSHA